MSFLKAKRMTPLVSVEEAKKYIETIFPSDQNETVLNPKGDFFAESTQLLPGKSASAKTGKGAPKKPAGKALGQSTLKVFVNQDVAQVDSEAETDNGEEDDEDTDEEELPNSHQKRKHNLLRIDRLTQPDAEELEPKMLELTPEKVTTEETSTQFTKRIKRDHLAWQLELFVDIKQISQANFGVHGQASRPLNQSYVQHLAETIFTNGLTFQSPLQLHLEKYIDPDTGNSDDRTTIPEKFHPNMLKENLALKFTVFGHQHLCEALKRVLDWIDTRRTRTSAVKREEVEKVKAHIWVGMKDQDLIRLGQHHNDVEHEIQLRNTWDLICLLRNIWKKNGSYFPSKFLFFFYSLYDYSIFVCLRFVQF